MFGGFAAAGSTMVGRALSISERGSAGAWQLWPAGSDRGLAWINILGGQKRRKIIRPETHHVEHLWTYSVQGLSNYSYGAHLLPSSNRDSGLRARGGGFSGRMGQNGSRQRWANPFGATDWSPPVHRSILLFEATRPALLSTASSHRGLLTGFSSFPQFDLEQVSNSIPALA
ncbi:hypothetical protein ASPZODRAFT_12724 [Penicilliopsis zonata CBS 506.65]|uniref:Uncharacterized protein n=1 Tax=Penicilliopsis zonata CBS 506.65 TaxID=1073090 RepID=A0A1L9SQV8_9EURO|nr:hypothetical protein ASPZODRAFT_12724 [Penicilliopsis zonata CBS 506.65]OJJ49600.1 hypothetical protein ASPZODRAFT_12724 [Penicilliopsis zonata CBS 506.65]